jgi:hypothetical protein
MEVPLGRTGPVRRRSNEEGGSHGERRWSWRRETGGERRWSWESARAVGRAGRRKNLATSALLAKDPKGTIASTASPSIQSSIIVWRRFVRWFARRTVVPHPEVHGRSLLDRLTISQNPNVNREVVVVLDVVVVVAAAMVPYRASRDGRTERTAPVLSLRVAS